jgi:hypothetical protein
MPAKRAVIVNVSAATAGSCVVAAGFYGFGGKNRVQVVAVGLLVDPVADCGEHVAVNFDAFVAEGGMVEDAYNVGHYFFHWDTWVLPGEEHTSKSCHYQRWG